MNIYLVTNGENNIVVIDIDKQSAINRCDSRFGSKNGFWNLQNEYSVVLLGKAHGAYSRSIVCCSFDYIKLGYHKETVGLVQVLGDEEL